MCLPDFVTDFIGPKLYRFQAEGRIAVTMAMARIQEGRIQNSECLRKGTKAQRQKAPGMRGIQKSETEWFGREGGIGW